MKHPWKMWLWSQVIQKELLLLFFAMRHPDTPARFKKMTYLLLAYLFSPLDLIPDWIPVMGWLDDLGFVSAGMVMLSQALPPHVREECLRKQSCWQERLQIGFNLLRALVLLWLIALVCALLYCYLGVLSF